MRRSWMLFLVSAFALESAAAATYHVAPNGDDGDPGTLREPWRTVAKANASLRPGDTVLLRAGEYHEPIHPVNSGLPGKPITYAAYKGEKPVITSVKTKARSAIVLDDRSYVVVDGIGANGKRPWTGATLKHWVDMNNAHHNVIRNCRFQYAKGWHGVGLGKGSHHNKFINNTMDCCGAWDRWNNSKGGQRTIGGRIPKEKGGGDDTGDLFVIGSDAYSNLIQGNHMNRGGHSLFNIGGYRNVIRNNVLENKWGVSRTKKYGEGSKGNRCSAITTKDRPKKGDGRNLYERNVIKNSLPASDQPLMTAAIKAEGLNHIIRRNVFFDNHNVVISTCVRGRIPVSVGIRMYHNVVYRNGGPAWHLRQWGGELENNVFKNNIVYRNRRSPPVSAFDVEFILCNPLGKNYVIANSIVKDTPGDARVSVAKAGTKTVRAAESAYPDNIRQNIEQPPRFVRADPAEYADFRLQAGSPVIDKGDFLTRTASAGSGTEMRVEDAGYFCDGFDVVEGDLIQLEGQRRTARVVKADYEGHVLALDKSSRWQKGQGVSLPYSGAAPDIGAHERR